MTSGQLQEQHELRTGRGMLMASAAACGTPPASLLSGLASMDARMSLSVSCCMHSGSQTNPAAACHGGESGPWQASSWAPSQHKECQLQCPSPGLTAATCIGVGSGQPFPPAPCRDDDSDEFYDRTAGRAKLKRAKAQEPALDAATLYGQKVGSLHCAHPIYKDVSPLLGPTRVNSGEAIPAASPVHHWLLQARCRSSSVWWLQTSTFSIPCSLLATLHP